MRGATELSVRLIYNCFISIHAPHAGCDGTPCAAPVPFSIFQSTRLMRGATAAVAVPAVIIVFQSTHPMRGATRVHFPGVYDTAISIHAPHARCDTNFTVKRPGLVHFNPRTSYEVRQMDDVESRRTATFQSTHLIRGATKYNHPVILQIVISIHAPRMGCDQHTLQSSIFINFNPRTSCEVRRVTLL